MADDETTDDAQAYADRIAELEARVTDAEARNAELLAHVDELEADPYRPIVGGQLGEVTPQLLYFQEQSDKAEQQAWDRTYGTADPVVEPVDPAIETATEASV